jgi:transcriptional regulator with XRE-family HTH domain
MVDCLAVPFFRSREVEVSAMNGATLRKWRKQLGFTQEEAAKHLDVSRATIQNWELEITAVPGAMDFACQECARRWKQRPDFGPVLLVYTEGLIWPPYDQPDYFPNLYCEPYPDNEAAIQRALRLSNKPNFANAWILEKGETVIWNSAELLLECTRRSSRNASRTARSTSSRRQAFAHENTAAERTRIR